MGLQVWRSLSSCNASGAALGLTLVALAVSLQPWWRAGLVGYDFQRWVETLWFLAVFWPLFCLTRPGFSVALPRWALYGAAALLVSMLVSAVLSRIGWFSWLLVLRVSLWCVTGVVLCQACHRLEAVGWRLLARLLLGLLAFYLSYALVGVVTYIAQGMPGGLTWSAAFGNRNYAAGFAVMGLLLSPGLVRLSEETKATGRWFWLAVLVMTGLWFLLLVIGARGAFLALCTVMGLSLFYLRKPAVKTLLLYLLGSLAVALGVFVLAGGLGGEGRLAMMDEGRMLSSSGRSELFVVGLKGFAESPWFGYGPLSYALEQGRREAHPHNLVINSLYEFGGLFTFTALLLVGRFCWHWFRKREVFFADPVAVSAGAAVIAFAVYSQVSGLTMIPPTMMLLLLALMLLCRPLLVERHVEEKATGSTRQRLLWRVSLGLVAVVYLLLVMQYWSVYQPGQGAFAPRFWFQGSSGLPD